MNPDLLHLLEETTTTLDQLLKSHHQLVEGFMEDNQIEQSQKRIEKQRSEIQKERDRIRHIRDVVRHRREVEQKRKENGKESKPPTNETVKGKTGTETILDRRGRVVGFRLIQKNMVTYLNGKGLVVGREIGGHSFDGRGRYFGRGQQGLRTIGNG